MNMLPKISALKLGEVSKKCRLSTGVLFRGLTCCVYLIQGTDDWIYQWEDEEIIQEIQ